MIYWTREIAGWALLGFGLVVFAVAAQQASQYKIFEVIILTVIGVFLFRGGIHLLKVAVAARVCSEAQERLYPDERIASGALPAGRSQGRAGWRA